MERVFNDYILPNWEGYTYFSPKQEHTNTGWIHGNIDRKINKTTKLFGYAATAAAA